MPPCCPTSSVRSSCWSSPGPPYTPDLAAEALERIDDLYENNFYLEEAAGRATG